MFGGLPTETKATEAITNLAKTVAGCISPLDLNSLCACLTAIVCSSEQPPLRSLGCPAGDGASVMLKSVRERVTHLLTDPQAGGILSMPSPALWQTLFDAFFVLLTKYCLSKYESVMQSILAQTTSNTEVIGPKATRAVSREMPVKLLRMSLPLTRATKEVVVTFAEQSDPCLLLEFMLMVDVVDKQILNL